MMHNTNKTSKSFKIVKYSRCHPSDGAPSSSQQNNNWVYLERQEMKVFVERASNGNSDDEIGWHMKVSAFMPGELVLEYFELTAIRLRQYQISGAQKDIIAGFRYTAENGDMRRFQLKFNTNEDCSSCCSVLSTFFPCRVVIPQSPAQLILSQQPPPLSQSSQHANLVSPPFMSSGLALSTAPFMFPSDNNHNSSCETAAPPPSQRSRPSPPISKYGMLPANIQPIPNDLIPFANSGVMNNNGVIPTTNPSSAQKAKRRLDDILYNELTDTIIGATAATMPSSSIPFSDETLRKKVLEKLSDPNFLQFVSRVERIISS